MIDITTKWETYYETIESEDQIFPNGQFAYPKAPERAKQDRKLQFKRLRDDSTSNHQIIRIMANLWAIIVIYLPDPG